MDFKSFWTLRNTSSYNNVPKGKYECSEQIRRLTFTSPFCTSLIPLSIELKDTAYGYKKKSRIPYGGFKMIY